MHSCYHKIVISISGEAIMAIIKTVGSSGQISLGKKFAGQTVMLDEIQAGVWMVKIGKFIPDNEKWLHRPDVQAELNEAIAWAEKNPPEDTNFEELEARIKR
jgi:hypothetical protein